MDLLLFFFFSSRRRHTRLQGDWSSDVCSSDLDGVNVVLAGPHEPLGLRASFVVGCDGAHSAVRHLLDLPFAGGEYDAAFMLADVDTDESLPADQLQLCPSESGPLAIFPMSASRRRIVATVQHPEGDTPSLDLVRRLLDQR